MLTSFLCGEFFCCILCCLYIYAGSFCYTSPAVLTFMQEFLLHILCWLRLYYLGSFSNTSRTVFFFFVFFFFSPPPPPLFFFFNLGRFSYASHGGFIFMWEVSVKNRMLFFFLFFFLGSFSYRSRASFHSISGPSVTQPMLASFFIGGSFSYTSHADFVFIWGSFSYTSRAGFIFIWEVWLNTSRAGFNFMRVLSLTHPTPASFLSGEFLLHVPCCFYFYFYGGNCSYTSHAALIYFARSLSDITWYIHFLYGEFLLHNPSWLHFYVGSLS